MGGGTVSLPLAASVWVAWLSCDITRLEQGMTQKVPSAQGWVRMASVFLVQFCLHRLQGAPPKEPEGIIDVCALASLQC